MKKMLCIGLMSGTSMDGIDAALIETDGHAYTRYIDFHSNAFSPDIVYLLKSAELALRATDGNFSLAENLLVDALQKYLLNEVNNTAEQYEQTINRLKEKINPINFSNLITHFTKLNISLITSLLKKQNLDRSQIDVIGMHGQTLLHKPEMQLSIQIGDGDYLAKRLNIKVVTNFRYNDIHHGGQGAPLVPYFHYVLAKQTNHIPCVAINCGGIANVTIIPSDYENNLLGFDTGPGNALIDRYVRYKTQGKFHMDEDGQFGKRGATSEKILKCLYEKAIQTKENFITMLPPKSLDTRNLQLPEELNTLSLEDGCRNLASFTADSIYKNILLHASTFPRTWILCGGGWNNPIIRYELSERLTKHNVTIFHADEIGWNSRAVESQAFAFFAARRLLDLPISFPQITGVSQPMIGGDVYLP